MSEQTDSVVLNIFRLVYTHDDHADGPCQDAHRAKGIFPSACLSCHGVTCVAIGDPREIRAGWARVS